MTSCKWKTRNKEAHYSYPEDFDFKNRIDIFTCSRSNGDRTRVIISNGIPDHDVVMHRKEADMCETHFAIEIPDPNYGHNVSNPITDPSLDLSQRSEIPAGGIIAMAINGVPAFGAQEVGDENAVDPPSSGVQDARYWYGHPSTGMIYHLHNPYMGKLSTTVDNTTLLGYALDGFPIYGPLYPHLSKAVLDDPNHEDYPENIITLDDCNGRMKDGKYQYHVRTRDQVDGKGAYCKPDGTPDDEMKANNWNYILGCYSGSVDNTKVGDSDNAAFMVDLDLKDCISEYTNTETTSPSTSPTASPTITAEPTEQTRKEPNIIIMQPDDLHFLEKWTPPPPSPEGSGRDKTSFPKLGLPNIERLRINGVQMMQAYTASPVCGTSRYSTITGRMPSRAGSNRHSNDGLGKRGQELQPATEPAYIDIPNTKLSDEDNQPEDCSTQNLAAALNGHGYATGMFGKWHLSRFLKNYTYSGAVTTIQNCGFDTVGGLYVENLLAKTSLATAAPSLRGTGAGTTAPTNGFFDDGSFSHNMEWVTYEAIKFLNDTKKSPHGEPFFMYFNPTVPHGMNDVEMALTQFPCQNTADTDNDLPYKDYLTDQDVLEPWIKGMSEDAGCDAYRQTVIDRAGSNKENLGKIWLDDAVGALLHALEVNGQLDDTIFLFQEDHGMDVKGGLYEGGIRIPQFVHYPNGIKPGKFHGLVSTIDIAATMMEYAGIPEDDRYDVDGKSWKSAIEGSLEDQTLKDEWHDRCLFFEMEQDRAVRCGCYKYIDINDGATASTSSTLEQGSKQGFDEDGDGSLLFDLCDGGKSYVTDCQNNREANNTDLKDTMSVKIQAFEKVMECYLDHTHPRYNMSLYYSDPDAICEYQEATVTSSPSAAPSMPSESPTTDFPSELPSASPSSLPTDAPCADSTSRFKVEWYHKENKKKKEPEHIKVRPKTCAKINPNHKQCGKIENQKVTAVSCCGEAHVAAACPQTCGLC